MINPAFNYAFVDLNEQEQVIHGNEVINRGGWQGVTTYYRFDGVTYDGDDFICLAPNSNVIPGTNPTIWSYLVQIEGESVAPSAGSDYVARSLGSLGYETALEAYALAQNGTNLIIAETGSRIAADQAIVQFVFGSIAVDLTAETGSRIAADQYLQGLIVAESGSRIAGEQAIVSFVFGSIAVDLTAETAARIAADAAESGTRSFRDQFLQNEIVAESGSRIAGQQAIVAFVFGSIAVDLTAETGSRIAADLAEATVRAQTDQYILGIASAGTVPPPLSTLPDVSIPTPTVNQVLAWDGNFWVAKDPASQVAPGAFTYFLNDLASGTLGYQTLTPIPSGNPEEIDSTVVSNGIAPIESYLSAALNRTTLDAGIWEFNTYASVDDASRPAYVVIDLHVLTLQGIHIHFLNGTSPVIDSTSPQLVTHIVSAGSINISPTDKLVAHYYALRSDPTSVTLSVYHSGSEHDSHFHTPLGLAHNDLSGLQGGSGSADQFYHTTLDQNQALQGTSGIPSSTNRYVTNDSLTAETSARSTADLTESGTRSSQDQFLFNLIVNLSGSSSGTFADISAQLAAETAARIAADNAETGTRSSQDQNLQNQITTEQGTRSSADQNLLNLVNGNTAAIVNEGNTRGSADSTLQGNINTEASTRATTDQIHQAEIDSLFALLGIGFSGTFAWWMSQIRGGLTDTKLNVVNGVITGITPSTFAWEDFEFYGTGSIGGDSLNLGTSWNGAAAFSTQPIPGAVAEEYYAALSAGPITSIPNLVTIGTGWADNGTVGAETTIGFYGSETFDSYSVGTVTVGEINAGFNWTGTASVTVIP